MRCKTILLSTIPDKKLESKTARANLHTPLSLISHKNKFFFRILFIKNAEQCLRFDILALENIYSIQVVKSFSYQSIPFLPGLRSPVFESL